MIRPTEGFVFERALFSFLNWLGGFFIQEVVLSGRATTLSAMAMIFSTFSSQPARYTNQGSDFDIATGFPFAAVIGHLAHHQWLRCKWASFIKTCGPKPTYLNERLCGADCFSGLLIKNWRRMTLFCCQWFGLLLWQDISKHQFSKLFKKIIHRGRRCDHGHLFTCWFGYWAKNWMIVQWRLAAF